MIISTIKSFMITIYRFLHHWFKKRLINICIISINRISKLNEKIVNNAIIQCQVYSLQYVYFYIRNYLCFRLHSNNLVLYMFGNEQKYATFSFINEYQSDVHITSEHGQITIEIFRSFSQSNSKRLPLQPSTSVLSFSWKRRLFC